MENADPRVAEQAASPSEGREQNERFFANRACAYYPCHAGANPNDFNCLFCYCPLYALGEGCGGNFRYTDAGIKDCSSCLLPHSPGGYDYILKKFPEIAALAKRQRKD